MSDPPKTPAWRQIHPHEGWKHVGHVLPRVTSIFYKQQCKGEIFDDKLSLKTKLQLINC